jgi:RNA polymerase sigma-70 factor, ECF subfamily
MEVSKPAAAPASPEREEVLLSLRERIVGFAASRISREAAEDLAQEVLLVLHCKYPEVERIEELVPLSLEILRFKIMGLRRKTIRRGEHNSVPVEDYPVADGGPDPEVQAERRERAERIAHAMTGMCSRCKELFRLKLEGRSFPEIREMMGAASLNTVYTWDFRCRKQLLELLGGSWEKGR